LPNRLNYLCWLHDLIHSTSSLWPAGLPVHVLDIGVGANAIYPLTGTRLYAWLFTGSDINPDALHIATQNVQLNPQLRDRIQLVLVTPSEGIQDIITTRLLEKGGASDDGMCLCMDKSDHADTHTNPDDNDSSHTSDTHTHTHTPFLLDMASEILPNRGPIRSLLAHMNAHCQHRLADCEHQVHSLLSTRHTHDGEDDDNDDDGYRRKSRKHTKDEQGSSHTHTQTLHTHGHTHTQQRVSVPLDSLEYTPIITAVMCNPPFYDMQETVCV
ncbi:DUF890 domain-containing protein, partial [archaeon]